MTELADEFIDEFIEHGLGDLVEGLAAPVPAYLTLEWLGLPLADWKRYSDVMRRIMYMTPADPQYPDLVAGHGWIVEQIEQTVSARRRDPRQDMISILTRPGPPSRLPGGAGRAALPGDRAGERLGAGAGAVHLGPEDQPRR